MEPCNREDQEDRVNGDDEADALQQGEALAGDGRLRKSVEALWRI